MSDLSTVRMPLQNGGFTVVDADDFEKFGSFKWHRGKTGYVFRSFKRGGRMYNVKLHRLIMGARPGQLVDHRDGDRVNNSKSNLRFTTFAGSSRNTGPKGGSSRFKGVSWSKQSRKWKVGIEIGGKTMHLGYFTDEVEAARAYDRTACQLHGEFVRPNFPA